MKKVNGEVERREFARLEKTLPVRFNLPDIPAQSNSTEALGRNIGEGGVFIETDLIQEEGLSLDKDKLLNLEIELLGRAAKIRARGEIAWISRRSRSPQKKSGFGVRFIQISAQEKRAISVFISRQMLAQTELTQRDIPFISREQKTTDRQRRNLEILDAIRKSRLISRAEISKHTDINIVTVSNYIDGYLKKGLVFERGLDISTGGRRPELVEINPQFGYVLGADLGPLNEKAPWMQVVATDFTSCVLAKAKRKRENEDAEDSIELLKDLMAEVLASDQVERKKVSGIGIAIPGIMDKFGGTVRNPFTRDTFANYVTIKKEIEREFALPVFVESSANCALFSERWTGANLDAKSANSILYVFSDHQCAVMLKDELYTGVSKSAGQLSFSLPSNGSAATEHCWMKPSGECPFWSQIDDLVIAAQSKENLLLAGNKLGARIAYLVNVFNPQVVIIGRQLVQLGDSLLDAIRHAVNRWSFRESANMVRIIPASLNEEAAALGAASLVIEAVFANI